MDTFEELLACYRGALERYVRFRLPVRADADDVLQEIYLTAYQKFGQLKNPESFKPWIVSIARNKCNDYFRARAGRAELPIDGLSERELWCDSRRGAAEAYAVRETLELLGDKDRQILHLYFWKELPQAEIARILELPLGTVKSRLHTAKQNFKNKYLYRKARPGAAVSNEAIGKGEFAMGRNMLPEFMPEYRIETCGEAPFSVKWEELMGWFLVPKLGEELTWGMYDMPSRRCHSIYEMKVTGRAMVHGIEGVELTAREMLWNDFAAAAGLPQRADTNREAGSLTLPGPKNTTDRVFVAQLTDTHCRYLATLRHDGDVRNYITFLDGDAFLDNWGFGEDNCGNETNLSPKGDIRRDGNVVTSVRKDFLLDTVGRYTVTIGGKRFDTVCVMDIETYNSGVVSEQFLDRDGRTVLWRRFNRDDWAFDRYGKKWTELLPDNDRLLVNGVPYVHWYDCITDHIC